MNIIVVYVPNYYSFNVRIIKTLIKQQGEYSTHNNTFHKLLFMNNIFLRRYCTKTLTKYYQSIFAH